MADRRESDYIPTPDEIAEKCLEIQATWSEQERLYRQRRAVPLSLRFDPEAVRCQAKAAIDAKLLTIRDQRALSRQRA